MILLTLVTAVISLLILRWIINVIDYFRAKRARREYLEKVDAIEQFQKANNLYPFYGINRPPYNACGLFHSDEILDHQYIDTLNNPEKMKDMPYELVPDEPGLGGFVKKLT